MKSFNKIILVGRLGADPEIRYTAGGMCCAKFAVATSHWDKRDKKEVTIWHTVKTFKNQAEYAGQRLQKGSTVLVEGELREDSWIDNDGATQRQRYVLSFNVQGLSKVVRQEQRGNQQEASPQNQGAPAQASPPADFDDDIPF